MAFRNRKKKTLHSHMVPIPFAAILVLIAALALAYLWLEIRCEALCQELKSLENATAELHKKCVYEESLWVNMKAPEAIERALRRNHLVMTWPRNNQILRLTTSDIARALAESSQEPVQGESEVQRIAMND